MPLARYEGEAVDVAGNVIPSPTVSVRLESTNALVPLFSDRDGLVSIGNPFTGNSDGTFAFHVAGGAFKIDVTAGLVTRTRRYVAIGTAAETDAASAISSLIGGGVNILTYGAINDGTAVSPTDNRVSIQNAADFAQSIFAPIIVPTGDYAVSGTTDGIDFYYLKLNGYSPLRGYGLGGSVIRTMKHASANVIHVKPIDQGIGGFSVKDLTIVGVTATGGRRSGLHGIFLDTRNVGGLAKPEFTGLQIGQAYSEFTLITNPFATVSGTKNVTVTHTAHAKLVGDQVLFSGSTTFNGVTITGAYTVTSVATNSYVIQSSVNASATGSGGGAAAIEISPNYAKAISHNNFSGAGTYGTNPYATVSGSTTVTVTHTAHGRTVGEEVQLYGATAFNNVTLNGFYSINSVTTNTYTVTALTIASATGSGGGSAAGYVYSANANGGVFGMIIRDCRGLGNGIGLTMTGDQNMIEKVITSGENAPGSKSIGVDVDLCLTGGGAGFFTMRDLTIVNKGGGYRITAAINFIFDGLYLECFGPSMGIAYTRFFDSSVGYAMAVVSSGATTIGSGLISGGRFAPQGGISTLITAGLYIGNAQHIEVTSSNSFYTATGSDYAIELDSASHDCIIHDPHHTGYGSDALKVLDRGARNRWNGSQTLTLTNGTNDGGTNLPATVYRATNGASKLAGLISKTSFTTAMAIATLPAGWRPEYDLNMPVYAINSATLVLGFINIVASTGVITYNGATCTKIDLAGVNWRTTAPSIGT